MIGYGARRLAAEAFAPFMLRQPIAKLGVAFGRFIPNTAAHGVGIVFPRDRQAKHTGRSLLCEGKERVRIGTCVGKRDARRVLRDIEVVQGSHKPVEIAGAERSQDQSFSFDDDVHVRLK